MKAVVIVGAARSGTNMLRDVLTQLPGFATWPCDEINYIWRYGNRSHPTDELKPEHAKPVVRSYIRSQFDKIARRTKASTVVEKTCANSLRVGFVDAVLPEAKYIFIYRDGRDVVASALKRWRAPFEPRYILSKARFVPVTDLPYYASRYIGNRVYRLVSREKRLAFWGPQFEGIEQALKTRTLPEVAAIQWTRSVEKALDAFAAIDSRRVHCVRYEDFVSDPGSEMRRLGLFLGQEIALDATQSLIEGVSPRSVGKWKQDLDDRTLRLVLPHLEGTLERIGYN
ncbi:MAG TPA: sulfotransferase [Thermomicrobiales bacterium]|nr:sulfotransferase [Thermomicrobiales bacterium]